MTTCFTVRSSSQVENKTEINEQVLQKPSSSALHLADTECTTSACQATFTPNQKIQLDTKGKLANIYSYFNN